MSTSYLQAGTTPLRIQKGSSRSPSPSKEQPTHPTSTPTPYTLKPRKASNASSHQEGARRTSSSYSHLRSNSLVSNSPFKGINGAEPVGPRHRPPPSGFNVYRSGPAPPSARSSLHISSSTSQSSQDTRLSPSPGLSGPRPQSRESKIPTPSRRTSTGGGSHYGLAMVPIASDSDAPPNAHKTEFKQRQSKGLQNLSDSERVSKSPFVARPSGDGERDRQGTMSPTSDEEWDNAGTGPETSPKIGNEQVRAHAIPELDEYEHELPDLPAPTPPEPQTEPETVHIKQEEEEDAIPPPPPPKPPLHARLAAITSRASTPPRTSTPPLTSTPPPNRSLTIDTTPIASPIVPHSPATSAYQTPLSPSQGPSTPTSPTKSPRRASANAPSPQRSSLVSKRLLGPRSSPSPRAPSQVDSPNTSGVSRTSSGRLVARRGSGVNRKNSRVGRRASGGRYVPLGRRKSGAGTNGRRRKTVTFDERCDVLEFDAGVGIDGEVWSEEDWSEEEDVPLQVLKDRNSGNASAQGNGSLEEGGSFDLARYASESPDASMDRSEGVAGGKKRYASPPMVPSGGWSEPVAWGSSPAMSTSGSGSVAASGSGSVAASGSGESLAASGSSVGRYANLGLGSPQEELDAYGFGRQAAIGASSTPNRPSTRTSIPTRVGLGAPGSTPGKPGFTPGRSGAGRTAGGVFGQSARDSFGRTGRSSTGRIVSGSGLEKVDEGSAVPQTAATSGQQSNGTLSGQDSNSSLPTQQSTRRISKLDAFSQAFPLENIISPDFDLQRNGTGALKVVNGSPGSEADQGESNDPGQLTPNTSYSDRHARGDDFEEHANELSEVIVHHSGAGVIVHHSGGAGVVVHHTGTGMVEGLSIHNGSSATGLIETVSVHHSGHGAVQIYDERSPNPSAGDISLGGGGLSFASLLSFDSIISRGEASRRRIEEEEEEEIPSGRILDGLNVDGEVAVKVEEEELDLGGASPNTTGPGVSDTDWLGSLATSSPGKLKSSGSLRAGFGLVGLPSLPGITEASPLMMNGLLPSSNPLSRSNSGAQASPAPPEPVVHNLEPENTDGSTARQSPRISRDEVRRRLMDRNSGTGSPLGRAGSSTPTGQRSPVRDESPIREGRTAHGPRMSGSRMEIERLMAGVERGFADVSGEGDSFGFNPADESHTSLPYRRDLTPDQPEEEAPTPAPAPVPTRVATAMSRIPMPSATNSVASGETETETEEAVTPPLSRSIPSGPGVGPRAHQLSPEIARLDPGRPSSFLGAFANNSRPNSYMSASSTGTERELTGREKIKAHEEMILAKRRELRGDSGKPARRRSRSTGDTLKIPEKPELLDIPVDSSELALEDSFNEQMKRIYDHDESRTYHLREADRTIYVDDKVGHHRRAGDVDNGKAWRTVRRPSDMNEYSRQIKEIRAQAGTTKAHGKVFVKVRGLQRLCVPMPQQPTFFTCTLNNGIHFVTTPDCQLEPNAVIDQEFELIEHGKLEFTLTIKIRKDSHILHQIKHMNAPSPLPQISAPPPPKPSGFRSFFSSTPKKQPKQALFRRPDPMTEDHLVRYLKSDGSLGRAYINFKDIVKRCDTRLFETSYPLIGEWAEDSVRGAGGIPGPSMSGPTSQRPVGELVLQIFRLPPLPGVPPETLPQSLEECHRGLRAVAWHKKIYHQGLLTQNGGDVMTWRRRQLRVIGSNLVAYNDVTGKAIATIDLKRALAVEDDQQPLPPNTIPGRRAREESDLVVERSFRLIFGNDDDIAFFADTDEEKAEWLRILRALVGNIPPHPLWAELVWQRHEQAAAAQQAQHANGSDQSVTGQAPAAPPPPSKPAAAGPRPQAWR